MLQDETAIAVQEQQPQSTALSTAVTPHDVIRQVRLVQEVMGSVMRDKEHYGTIPGCGDKPTLLQPGAQVLALTFRLAPEYDITTTDFGSGHREYTVHCSLISTATGQKVGSGVGSCSTMESKYRYRVGEVTDTGKPVPGAYWKDRDVNLLGGKGYKPKKIDGAWHIVIQGDKVENPDIADVYNTVLKMGKKRAFVDAVLCATAASDMFTQDIEDLPSIVEATPIIEGTVVESPAAPTTPPDAERIDVLMHELSDITDQLYVGMRMTKAEAVGHICNEAGIHIKDAKLNADKAQALVDAGRLIVANLNQVAAPAPAEPETAEVIYADEDIPF